MHASSALITSLLLVAPAIAASYEAPGSSSGVLGNSANQATSEDIFNGKGLKDDPEAAAALLAEGERFGAATNPEIAGVGSEAAYSSSWTPSAAPAAAPVAAPAPVPVDGSATVQVVTVGGPNGALTFSPSEIYAEVGSFVQFQFQPKNHSVVQSNFANPCVPINTVQPEVMGFFSGFMPVSPDAKTNPVFTVQVKDQSPMWFYCSQGKHCQMGMGGVINPPKNGERTLAKYIEAAKSVPTSQSPSHPIAQDCEIKGNSTSPSSPVSTPTPAFTTYRPGLAPTNSTTGLPAGATTSSANGRSSKAAWSGLAGLALAGVAAYVL